MLGCQPEPPKERSECLSGRLQRCARSILPEDQRRIVKTMAGFGIPQDDIALHLRIDPKTLRKHFRDELDRGITEANVRVAQSLFRMATEGQNVAAAIFWMKARAGWREKHEINVTAQQTARFDAELKHLSLDELKELLDYSDSLAAAAIETDQDQG